MDDPMKKCLEYALQVMTDRTEQIDYKKPAHLSSKLIVSLVQFTMHKICKPQSYFNCLMQARQYANKIQDFNKEYNDIALKCETFAISMLDKCTTKHEIQTLLQTKETAR